MGFTNYKFFSNFFSPGQPDQPKPPPLPSADYVPGSEPPLWNWKRLSRGVTDVEGNEHWPRPGGVPKEDDKPDWRGVIKKNVIELPLPGKYGHGLPQDQKYFFFDTPDYADPFKKLWSATKIFFRTGMAYFCLVGIWENKDIMNFKYTSNLLNRTFRPWFVGGMIGTLGVVTIANLRNKKDDYWNYAFGGFLMGSYIGRRHYLVWFRNVVIWTPVAVLAKHNAEINGIFWPNDLPTRAGYVSVSGNSADHGIASGDLRPFVYARDPGRDTRQIAK